MSIQDFIPVDLVLPSLRAGTKAAILTEIARKAGAAFSLDEGLIRSALEKREALGSTGIGDGIAIPHARLDEIVRPLGLLARLRNPVDFDAVDERPVDLVVLLLLPMNPHGAQLNALASVARRLRDPDVAAALRSARDAQGLHAAMCGAIE